MNTLTLAQWAKQYKVSPTHPTTERKAVSVVIDHTDPGRRGLWQLDDYYVSSVCGIVIWLVPR